MQKVLSISIIVPVYNAENVLWSSLSSIIRQDYPFQEIIIIDNHSLDNSMRIANRFKESHININIKIVRRKKSFGVSSSYNLGAKLAHGDYIVTFHSDSLLPSGQELRKLIRPFVDDIDVIATGPLLVHPRKIWLKYNFWQKCLLATAVGTEISSGNGKFDCYKKAIFINLGGFDEKRFTHSIGTEDADMNLRLAKIGKIVKTDARVIHNHPSEPMYSLNDWIARRKFLAISYGRHLQLHLKELKFALIYFLLKPILTLISLLIIFNPIFIVPIFLFPFLYMPKMFIEPSTLKDPRIFLLPFIIVLLVYYETFWELKSLFFMREYVYNKDL